MAEVFGEFAQFRSIPGADSRQFRVAGTVVDHQRRKVVAPDDPVETEIDMRRTAAGADHDADPGLG